MNESWHIYECVMSCIWGEKDNECLHRIHESWHRCKWVMAHLWTSHGAYMNELWHTLGEKDNECLHHINDSYHTYECVAGCCRVLQGVAGCCRVLQWIYHMDESYHTYERVAVCGSVWQCVAVCCSVLQCVAVNVSYEWFMLKYEKRKSIDACEWVIQHTATHCNTL